MRCFQDYLIPNGFSPDILKAEFEAMKTEYKETVALGSVVSPEDVAKAIVYLAIDATQTAGEFLVVDGGYLLGR